MLDNLQINLFYPVLFITIGCIIVALIYCIKVIMIRFKDNDSENYRFKAHIEEHIDTTTKITDMHNKVVTLPFTVNHEKELHKLEVMVEDLNQKFDILLEHVIKLGQK